MNSVIKRFYFDNKIFAICLVVEALLICSTFLSARAAGILDLFASFEIGVRSLLLVSLFRAHRKENLFLMSGLSAGLLFCILYREADFVLGNLMTQSVSQYIMMGFKGSLFLCISMTILFLECIMVYNHFSIDVRHVNGITKLRINQLSTIMLLIMLIIQILSNIFLDLNFFTRTYQILATLSEGILFAIIGHCDLIMALDREDAIE